MAFFPPTFRNGTAFLATNIEGRPCSDIRDLVGRSLAYGRRSA